MQLVVSGSVKQLRQKYVESLFPPTKTAYLTPHVEEGKSIKVEAVRELLKNLATDSQVERLVYLDEAERLTPASQNTLLKALEEPPTQTHFIFSVKTHLQLLPTILSRCNLYIVPKQKTSPNPELLNNLKKLMTQNTAQRLNYLTILGKDRQSILAWLETLTDSIHNALTPDLSLKSQRILSKILQKTLDAQQGLTQNGNPTLIMGNYLLSLPKTV